MNAEANYRPISLLSHVVKIFEKQVHKQWIEYLEARAFITPYQSAYLKKHSTVTCLHRVVDDLWGNIDDGDLCGVCFLDIEKYFDSINHKILILQKLKYYGIDTISLGWFQSYVHGRSQCVRVNDVMSDETPCHIGVPQGSILGPLLFLLYVNDLSQYVQNQNCNIFADDTIIYSFGSNVEEISCKMQGALDSIMPWYMTNRLSIIANKSAVMLIGRPYQVDDDIDIEINDVRIEQVQSMKYLGIYIDNKLSGMFSVTSYVSMLQARYRSFVELNNSLGLVHLNWLRKERSSLHLILIMPVLCGATQNKVSSRNQNGLKTTLLELLRETLIMSISKVLIYHMSSTGHQSKEDMIILHR